MSRASDDVYHFQCAKCSAILEIPVAVTLFQCPRCHSQYAAEPASPRSTHEEAKASFPSLQSSLHSPNGQSSANRRDSPRLTPRKPSPNPDRESVNNLADAFASLKSIEISETLTALKQQFDSHIKAQQDEITFLRAENERLRAENTKLQQENAKVVEQRQLDQPRQEELYLYIKALAEFCNVKIYPKRASSKAQ